MKYVVAALAALGLGTSAFAVEITVPMGYNPIGIDPVTMECTVPGKVTSVFTDRNGNSYVSCTSQGEPRQFIDSKLDRNYPEFEDKVICLFGSNGCDDIIVDNSQS
ncbi:hypothetical protein [Pelagibacterium montanilacus]|uniref:hypothetical protein n=1 Tax=Pelagibacterium montanilacus TaxID=2185280 RepID=UPI000F8E6257|nr:hypothetical protein [Pelagibacterium montanilacus]